MAKRKTRPLRILALALIAFIVVFVGAAGVYLLLNPVALRATEFNLQTNTAFEPLDNLRYVFLGSKDDVSVSGYENIDINHPGTYEMSYTYNGEVYPFTLVVGDSQAPELELRDITTDTVADLSVMDFVSSVMDDSRYTISFETQPTHQAGDQNVTVIATDIYGNSTTKNAKLTRIEDTEAPVLENVAESVEIKAGHDLPYSEYVVSDNLDANPVISVLPGNYDLDVPGNYEVTIAVTDRSGNQNTYTQNVNVKDNKTVYFTFDDGPSQNTKEIIDILNRYGVTATFFVTGQNPEYYPYMKEAADSGHTIAIHTLTHDFATVYSSPEAYFADLEAMKDIIREYTGIEADCIRFPGGSSNTVSANYSAGIMSYLVDAVHQAGYEYFDWNADSTDASGNNVAVDQLISNATLAIGEPEVVILFHDTDAKDTTVEALPSIIEAYLNAGYEFEGVSINSFGAHHGVNN